MTFSLFDLYHFLTTPYDKLHDTPNTSAPLTRSPLRPSQKKALERQFCAENARFGDIGRKKRQGEMGALSVGLALGALSGVYAYKRSYQVLSGLVFGSLTFIVTRHAANQAFPWLGNYAQHLREYNRAFSLWVMYTQHRKQPFDLPMYQAKAKLDEEIQAYKRWKSEGLTPKELELKQRGELV